MKSQSQRNHQLSRLRSRARGAALVEAALVIPIMLVFYGLIMFTHKNYSNRINSQTLARTGTLYYASHNCKTQLDVSQSIGHLDDKPDFQGSPGSSPSGEDFGNDQLNGATNNTASQVGMGEVTSSKWNIAHLAYDGSPIQGNASLSGKRFGLRGQNHSESEVSCNEEALTNKWTAVFKFLGRGTKLF